MKLPKVRVPSAHAGPKVAISTDPKHSSTHKTHVWVIYINDITTIHALQHCARYTGGDERNEDIVLAFTAIRI